MVDGGDKKRLHNRRHEHRSSLAALYTKKDLCLSYAFGPSRICLCVLFKNQMVLASTTQEYLVFVTAWWRWGKYYFYTWWQIEWRRRLGFQQAFGQALILLYRYLGIRLSWLTVKSCLHEMLILSLLLEVEDGWGPGPPGCITSFLWDCARLIFYSNLNRVLSQIPLKTNIFSEKLPVSD